jgi:sugar/nucleoside kinase (ribokinase family)
VPASENEVESVAVELISKPDQRAISSDESWSEDLAGDQLDVVAFGSALVDVLVHVEDSRLVELDLIKGSMALVDLAASRKLYDNVSPIAEISGGSAANTVAGVAALGGRAGFVGKVASDPLGEIFALSLAEVGVELSSAFDRPVDPQSGSDLSTGHCVVLVTPEGERTMVTHLGVASTLNPADVDPAFVSKADVVYLEGYLWDLEAAKDALRLAVSVAHGSNTLVALTVSDPFCVERHRAQFLELIENDLDLVFANEDELLSLFKTTSFDKAVSSVEEIGILAAVTRGSKGSVVIGPHGVAEVAAAVVERVIDTTGAGDLYAAGFLYGLTHGLGPSESAELGGLCAAEVISHLGARPLADLSQLV